MDIRNLEPTGLVWGYGRVKRSHDESGAGELKFEVLICRGRMISVVFGEP
jgi:hypothetical protein